MALAALALSPRTGGALRSAAVTAPAGYAAAAAAAAGPEGSALQKFSRFGFGFRFRLSVPVSSACNVPVSGSWIWISTVAEQLDGFWCRKKGSHLSATRGANREGDWKSDCFT